MLGADAPSNQITLGLIGCGGQGTGNLRNLMGKSGTRGIAVCDPDKNNMNRARDHVNQKNGNKDCETFTDFRDLCAMKDLDAVIVGTPDHWHSLACLEALNNKKDVYCEKPLTHNIHESVEVIKTVKKYNRILQTGSMQRSSSEFRIACELVRSGVIGK